MLIRLPGNNILAELVDMIVCPTKISVVKEGGDFDLIPLVAAHSD